MIFCMFDEEKCKATNFGCMDKNFNIGHSFQTRGSNIDLLD